MPHVTVEGVRFWAEREGSGPPVVLLHGFTGTTSTWRSLVEALRGEFTTIAIDHIGHGQTDAPQALDRYRMARAVDDLVAVARELGAERAAWVGYSLGGRTALQVAVRHPEAVSALVLEGASAGLATVEEREARIAGDEDLARLIEEQGVPAFVDYWQSIPLWSSQARNLTDAERATMREQRLAQSGTGLANSLRGMGTGAQTWLGDALPDVRVPVLATAGSLDVKYAGIAHDIGRTVPQGAVRIIQDAGHAAHLERPEAFNSAVLAFLREHRPNL